MNHTALILGLLMISAIPARAEIQPFWDSITVTTSRPGQSITIHAARGEGRLTNLVVTVGAQSASVPHDELKDVLAPDLGSIRFVYREKAILVDAEKELQRFYVSMECVEPDSRLTGKLPETVIFHFVGTKYSQKERWREIPPSVSRHFKPEPETKYAVVGTWLFPRHNGQTASSEPAEGKMYHAWSVANEFVYRTALADEYVLPAHTTDALGDGVYHVAFAGKHGGGDLLVEVEVHQIGEREPVRVLRQSSQQESKRGRS